MWIEYNPNPLGKNVGDCVVRAVSKAIEIPWENAYSALCIKGFTMGDMPSSNAVLSEFLKENGFRRQTIENCKDCYTINDFCRTNPNGVYVVGTGTHVVAVLDGDYYDAWKSGDEMPVYCFERVK